MSDEPSNPADVPTAATAVQALPAQEPAPVLGYRSSGDDAKPMLWADLIGLIVSCGAGLVLLVAAVESAVYTAGLNFDAVTLDLVVALLCLAVSAAALYLAVLCVLTFAGWVRYGRPPRRS